MRITAEAYLTAMFRFLGDGLLGENERLDIAVCILDELEEVTGVQFSPDERERLIDTVAKLLSEKTSISDVKEFINSRSEESPSVAVFFLPPESLRVRKVEGKSAVESSKFQSEKDERNSNRKNQESDCIQDVLECLLNLQGKRSGDGKAELQRF